jgi:hypothetical protein
MLPIIHSESFLRFIRRHSAEQVPLPREFEVILTSTSQIFISRYTLG